MSQSTIISIIEKYSTGSLSPDEEQQLHDWLVSVDPSVFHETLDQCSNLPAGLRERPVISPAFAKRLEHALDASESDTAAVVRIGWKKWVGVAAAVITFLGYFAWLWVSTVRMKHEIAVIGRDVKPGKNGAILTLADGRQVVLDSVGAGFSATDGGAMIKKNNEQLTYAAGNTGLNGSAAVLYNTLSTPKGRKQTVALADGTRVWLNAASSIRYPTVFSGKDRVVEISGEACFEVAPNAAKPFVVRRMGSEYAIQVLGTSFNVNAYDDEESIKTTLLDGAVRVQLANNYQTLKPGQQAVAEKGQSTIALMSGVNTAEVMAWKNGLFNFDRADIHTVMRQIARWYDVEVEYKGAISRHFGGTISQDVNVSQVLTMLELTGAVKFNIEGKKIVVMP